MTRKPVLRLTRMGGTVIWPPGKACPRRQRAVPVAALKRRALPGYGCAWVGDKLRLATGLAAKSSPYDGECLLISNLSAGTLFVLATACDDRLPCSMESNEN